MDRARYSLALVEMMLMPGALLYWFSIHPFVRFWRGVGVRATVTLHIYDCRGRGRHVSSARPAAGVEYGTNPALIAISVPVLLLRWYCAPGAAVKMRILMGIPSWRGNRLAAPAVRRHLRAIRHPRYLEFSSR